MANPSLQIGNEKWAIKEDNLLGYSTAGTRFVPQPITMTRGSAGARVNSEGLVETVELLGSEEVTNSGFDTSIAINVSGSGWKKVIAGDCTVEYANGGVKLTQASVGNQDCKLYAQTVGGSSNLLTAGKSYKVTYEVLSNNNSTDLKYYRGGSYLGIDHSVGTHTFYYEQEINQISVFWNRTANSDITLDNISIKESTKNNLARVDYDGSVSSLLVEPERTNLLLYSEELTSTSNVTLSNTTSPDGTLNALKVSETASSSQHFGSSYNAEVVSGTIYTVSFYIKKGTYDSVSFYTQSLRIRAQLDITFSTESTSLSGLDVVSGSNFMEDAGNGWYRVGLSATANSTGSVLIYISPKDLSSYAGDISQYTEFWGMQLEEGSYATSIIPTSGSTVTRVKDLYSKTGISNLINSEEGSFFVDIAALKASPGSQLSISLSGDNSNDRVLIYTGSGGGEWVAQFRKDSTTIVTVKRTANVASQSKVAISWKSGKYLMYIDGDKATNYTVGSETEATTFDVGELKNLQFNPNYGTTSNPFYGKVKQLQVFKTALSDSELTALTT